MITLPSTPFQSDSQMERISYKIKEAAVIMGVCADTFRARLLDTGRIHKNLFGGIWRDDLLRIQEEELAKRQKAVITKLRKVA